MSEQAAGALKNAGSELPPAGREHAATAAAAPGPDGDTAVFRLDPFRPVTTSYRGALISVAGNRKTALLPVPKRHSRTFGSRLRQAGSRLREAIPAMLAQERAHGHAFLALPVLIGLGAVVWFCLPSAPNWRVLAGGLVCSLAAVVLLRNHVGPARLVPVVATLILTGMLLAACEDWRRATIVLDQPVSTIVTGVVETRESNGSGRWRYQLLVENTASPQLRRPPSRVALLSRVREPVFRVGDRISGRARLSPPSGPALPGLADFAFSAYFDGIGATGFFYGAPTLVGGPVDATWGQRLERTFYTWRSGIASRIRSAVPGDAGAFAAAIVTDERRAISAETTEALRVSGLAHIVAISGLNMALAAGIFFVGMRSLLTLLPTFAQIFPVKKLAAAAALMMATGYYLISGFGVSAERAYIMIAIMLVAVFFDRPSISLRNVALAALVVLALSPSKILGASFQMSFAATVALVAGYAAWSQRQAEAEDPPWRPATLKPVFAAGRLVGGIFATSLIGGLSTAIFSIDHFHRVSTYGLAANLAAMPLVSFVVMPFGLIGMLLMPLGLETPFLKVMGLGLDGVIAVAKSVAGWGGDVTIGRQPSWFLPVASVGLIALVLPRTRLKFLGIPFAVLAVFLSWRSAQEPLADFLVAEDGSLVALLANGTVATNRARPPGFVYSQWQYALALPRPAGPVMIVQKTERNAATVLGVLDTPLVEDSNATAIGERAPVTSNLEPSAPATTPNPNRRTRQPLAPDEIAQARRTMRVALSAGTSGRFSCRERAWCVAKSAQGLTISVVEDARFAGLACDIAQVVVATYARFERCRSGALMINGKTLRQTGALEIRFNGSSDPAKWSVAAAMATSDRSWSQHRRYDWRRDAFDLVSSEPLRLAGGQPSDSGE